MKNLVNLAVLGVFTTCVTLGLVKAPDDLGGLENIPSIVEPFVEDFNQNLEVENQKEQEYLQGIYVTTIYNLDFPTQKNLNEIQLKNEIDEILDNIADSEVTDVFFQVRPCADAFYYSDLFPTSVYLTGSQEKEADFDILEYYIEGSHQRGLKLHAWINPYRITKDPTDILADTHIAITNPELTVLHTDGNLYFNPGIIEAQEYIIKGVQEIIENYNVDGIHFDDYFYPSTDFDDSEIYNKLGNGRSLEEFRRDSITNFVSDVNDLIKSYDDNILFGISPAGIWANAKDEEGGSNTAGSGSYTRQYADTKGWVEAEIIDYIAPQVYWKIGFEIAEYKTLVDWWSDVCDGTNVNLYIAQANYREVDGSFEAGEIANQIDYNKTKDNVSGSIYFRYEHVYLQ